jgi:hypothetical protein
MIVNGNVSDYWQYVRMTASRYNQGPVEDVNSQAIRCNEHNPKQLAAVANVVAGSTIGFKASNTMGHPGPVMFYMARVPAGQSAINWPGTGPVWFKISQQGAKMDGKSVSFATGMVHI